MRSYLLVAAFLLCAGAAHAAEAPGAADFSAGWRAVAAPAKSKQSKGALQARQDALMAAIPHFERAVSADPGSLPYRLSLGYTYLSAGKYDMAKATLDEAARKHRDDPLLYLLRAQAEATIAFAKPAPAQEKAPGGPSEVVPPAGPKPEAKDITLALRYFDDAARFDPENSLALLQSASVAFEAGRTEMALKSLHSALQRPGIKLYRLPVPEDLDISKAMSIKMWQHAQMWQWLEQLARCQNVARMVTRYGRQKEEAGDREGAAAAYQEVLAIGKQVGSARPNMFISLNTGINLMEDGYGALIHLYEPYPLQMAEKDWSLVLNSGGKAVVRGSVRNISTDSLTGVKAAAQFQKANGSPLASSEAALSDETLMPGKAAAFEVTTASNPEIDHVAITFKSADGRTIPYLSRDLSPQEKSRSEEDRSRIQALKGEAGVLFIGRQEMLGPLQSFAKSIEEQPPASADEALDREGQSVAFIMAGVGLSPTHKPLPKGSAKPTPPAATGKASPPAK